MGQGSREVIRSEVRIVHGHLDTAVAQDALQGDDTPGLHHVVAVEGMAEYVGHLPWRMQAGALVGFAEG